MKEQELLGHLLDLARRLDFEVRTDQGPFRDGSCRLEERKVIVLNRNSPAHRRIAALSRALSECSLEGIFLLPAVREAIERASTNPAADHTSADRDETQATSE